MKMKWFPVRRMLRVFDKKSDKHIRSFELPNFSLKEVQKVFGQEVGDLMYFVYTITDKEVPYFRKKYGYRFHFKKYEYCLDCERITKRKRPRVRRLFAIYDKKTEIFIRDYELTNFNLGEMQKLFSQDDPMHYCYRITEKEAPYFRKKYGRRFFFKKKEYFLETRKY